VLRPRFTANLSPEKHAPRKLVETCYPGECQGPTLQQLLEGNEPTLEKLAGSDAKFLRAVDFISKGKHKKRSRLTPRPFYEPLCRSFTPGGDCHGDFEEEHGFAWVVPPDEPIEKAKQERTGRPKHPHSGGKSIRLALRARMAQRLHAHAAEATLRIALPRE